jgi:D-beta-D-heptose 7-phosphate kinase / D-beta-D-heptose 1-phosphate adenosyltransferase
MKGDALLTLLREFHQARVLVVGDLMLDRFVYGRVERISPEAPIPVLGIERSEDMLGGAANVARNIAALGGLAILVGVLGEDIAASALRAQLDAFPSIEPHVVIDRTRPTTLKIRYVADGQQIMRADLESRASLSAEAEILLLNAVRGALPTVHAVVLSDYAKGAVSDSVASNVIGLARNAGVPVIVDPKCRHFAKYRGATIITPNRLELQHATVAALQSNEDIENAAESLVADAVCEIMVVTRGDEGMSVIGRGLKEHLRTTARQVFDVSGAGDTVIATLALAIGRRGDIMEACKLANLAAGIVVGKPGTATVSAGEVMLALAPIAERSDAKKFFALDSIAELAREWRVQGLRVAFTNGCFDLLHPGHISLLEQARQSADRLIVGLNSDASVTRLKGIHRPIQGEGVRAVVLTALKSVDAVVIFDEDTPIELIEVLKPDVLVKGSDYRADAVVGADVVRRNGGRVLLASLVPGHSTTETVRRVLAPAAA